MAPEYRRCAIYGMTGCALAAIVVFWLENVLDVVAHPSGATVLYVILAVTGLALLLPLHWRLRVDGSGIARRGMFRWDVWSWGDFASGRIEKRPSFTFIDPERPWWSNRLNIAPLARPDLQEVIRFINKYYLLPAPPVVSIPLVVEYGFRRTAEFDHCEIRLKVRGERFSFNWTDVMRLHITRFDPLRRDFTALELELPGHEIKLTSGTDAEKHLRMVGASPTLRK